MKNDVQTAVIDFTQATPTTARARESPGDENSCRRWFSLRQDEVDRRIISVRSPLLQHTVSVSVAADRPQTAVHFAPIPLISRHRCSGCVLVLLLLVGQRGPPGVSVKISTPTDQRRK
ncbi:unnamed protein product [Soboliphyme baturini]|uniref:Uncharacterized protein n=1 Tax=Soboliphyme baturini TaxID=241478 RepID=A0A183IK05_9BILA|nr:unnamed protein product [Soboliphyme baturini]